MDMFIEFNLKDLKTFNFNLIINEQEVTEIEAMYPSPSFPQWRHLT